MTSVWRKKAVLLALSLNGKRLFLLMLGVAGVLTILHSTRWGAGLSHDALGYIGGAKSLLHGQGYSHVTPLGQVKPTIQWPPLFSLALTPFGLVGIGIPEGARWLNAFLFGINIVVVGYLLYYKTSFLPSLFGSILILTSVALLNVHAMAWTEPLYILLGLIALYWLDVYIKHSKLSALILSASCVGAAALTRYIGVTLIVTLCISILLFGKRGLRRRFLDCLLVGLVSSLPLLVWLVRNHLTSGHLTNQHFQMHLMTGRHFKQGVDTFASWLLLDRIADNMKVLTLLGVALTIISLAVWLRNSVASSFVKSHMAYVVTYCLGMAFFVSFWSLDFGFHLRYLCPVFVSGVLISGFYLHEISLRATKWFMIGITALCAVFICGYVRHAVLWVKDAHQYGLGGFESLSWKQSKLVASVKDLPRDILIYANYATGMAFLSQRKIGDLPLKFDEHTGDPYNDYVQKLQEIGERSKRQRTVIVYVKGGPINCLSRNELQKTLSLREIEKTSEGSIYEVSPLAN